MAAAPPWRIMCSSLRSHRRASSSGGSVECVESVLCKSLPSDVASYGDDGFFSVVVVLALGCGLQAGGSGVLRRLRRPETADLRPKEHGVEPRSTRHSDMCSVIYGSAFFGSQSIDAMVLRRFFGLRCLSPPTAMSMVWLVVGGRRRFGSAIDSLKGLFINFFYVGCFLLMCQDGCPHWCCSVWSTYVVFFNFI